MKAPKKKLFFVLCCIGFMMLFSKKYYDKQARRFEVNVKLLNRLFTGTEHVPVLQKCESPGIIEEFMDRYSVIHKKRINHTREMCLVHRDKIAMPEFQIPTLLVNEKHKMVYCQTPKVGTVSWSRILLILSGYKDYTAVMRMTAPEVSKAWKREVSILQKFPQTKQKEIMNTYTKFMFVRHPFSRLLSAFNDKLGPDKKTYGTFQELYNRILRDFKYDKQDKSNKVQFKDFLNFIVHGRVTLNVHWRPMHTVCFPCDVNYDIIGHFEDIENDSKYILNITNVDDLELPKSSVNHQTNSSSESKINKAFASIPAHLLASIYNIFKYDFTLFDYEIPIALP